MKVDLLISGLPGESNEFVFGLSAVALIRDDRHIILFDTGYYRIRQALPLALKDQGLSPDDVDTVFLSHLHWDHIMNVDLFRKAVVLIPRSEYEYAKAIRPGDWKTPTFVYDILAGLRIELLDDRDVELFPGVHTLYLPGHSIGTQGLAVATDNGVEVLASDVVWSAKEAIRGVSDKAAHDIDMATRSLKKALAAGRVIYPGHDRPFTIDVGNVRFLSQNSYEFTFPLNPYGGPPLKVSFSTGPASGLNTKLPGNPEGKH
jgi:glyoxylase-like metal-dependent hydrolase (beta-lactamase superfamily II)